MGSDSHPSAKNRSVCHSRENGWLAGSKIPVGTNLHPGRLEAKELGRRRQRVAAAASQPGWKTVRAPGDLSIDSYSRNAAEISLASRFGCTLLGNDAQIDAA